MIARLTILLFLVALCAWSQPLLPAPPAARPRFFAATTYRVTGDTTNESVFSNVASSTNAFPFTISFDAPAGEDFDGFKIYTWRLTNAFKVFDLGTNTSFLMVAPTSPPAPPFNLILSNAAGNWTVTNHDDAQRFYRALVQTSTDLKRWETFSGIPITLTKQ